ncbi:cAMP-dependent protein kinase regulatory subunit [Saccharomyces cerevisiae]|nr:cAMP-dependent protein kinase regulatory subunit [Saccharomyces cerevisiae]
MVSSLPKESQAELQLFQNEINAANPSDFLQFSANYFNKRLEQQRAFLKAREPEFKAKNIVLISGTRGVIFQTSISSISIRSRSSVMFKSPFVNEDPHSNVFKSGFNLDPHEQDTHQQAQKNNSILEKRHQLLHSQCTSTPKGQQLQRLEKSIRNNFLFNKLDSDSKRLVINCLEEKSVPKGATIIKQGDQGDYFYVVEKGTVDFYVNDNKVNSSGPGSSFGELALMYNSPRAATVVAPPTVCCGL